MIRPAIARYAGERPARRRAAVRRARMRPVPNMRTTVTVVFRLLLWATRNS